MLLVLPPVHRIGVIEMTDRLMTVKEVARYLSINEKKVYALIKRGGIPCTKVTGKWLFPKRHVDRWLEESLRGAGRFERSVICSSTHLPYKNLAVRSNFLQK